MVLLCTHDKKFRVSPVGFMSIAFFLEQTDVLKQTHIVITDNHVAETLCTYRCGNLTFFSAILLVSNKNNPFCNQIGSTPWVGYRRIKNHNLRSNYRLNEIFNKEIRTSIYIKTRSTVHHTHSLKYDLFQKYVLYKIYI